MPVRYPILGAVPDPSRVHVFLVGAPGYQPRPRRVGARTLERITSGPGFLRANSTHQQGNPTAAGSARRATGSRPEDLVARHEGHGTSGEGQLQVSVVLGIAAVLDSNVRLEPDGGRGKQPQDLRSAVVGQNLGELGPTEGPPRPRRRPTPTGQWCAAPGQTEAPGAGCCRISGRHQRRRRHRRRRAIRRAVRSCRSPTRRRCHRR